MGRLLPIVAVFITNLAFGQYVLRGVVYDNNGVPLPGANINESPDGSTVTGADGRFMLNSSKPQERLIVSFIGFKPAEVMADTSQIVEVTLEADEPLATGSEPWFCVFYDKHSKIGVVSGVRNAPFGIRIENFTPDLFGVWPLMTTGFEWRKNSRVDNYIDIFLRRVEIFRLGTSQMSFSAEFKEVTADRSSVKQVDASPDLTFKRLRISAGYIYQTVADNEAHKSGQGISLCTYVYLFGHLGIDLKTDFVMNNFQPDLRAFWDFDKPRISFGIRYEKMPYLEQLTACLQYKLSY